MRQTGRYPSYQVQKYRSGMLVGWNRLTKSHIPEMLQRIGKSIVCRVPSLPKLVSFEKFLRSKRCKTEQIVRTVFNHIDAEIVASINAQVRAMRISKTEAFKFHQPIERGMLQSFDLRNVHQTQESFLVKYFTVGRKHAA